MKERMSFWLAVIALAVALLAVTTIAVFAGPLLATQSSAGGAPSMVSYQGRVSVGGQSFSGVGYFKFAIVDSAGTTTYWSNDNTSTGGGAPSGAVALTVQNGLFTVLLGDVVLRTNMTQPLTAAVFSAPERSLRVWFSSESGKNFIQLAPDTRLASAPYALQAEQALHALQAEQAQVAQMAQRAQNADYGYYPLFQAQSLDLTLVNTALKGFRGGFTDGRYGYFVPGFTGSPSGRVARVDLHNFSTGGVSWIDLTTVGFGLVGFMDGFTDGRYGYFVPYDYGRVARVDLQNFTIGGVSWIDLQEVDSDLRWFSGGFTDGRYGYLAPYGDITGSRSGKVARIDLQNFSTGAVSTIDLTTVDSDLKGFWGGFTDGRYGYFVPHNNGNLFGKVARVDLQNFTTSGVSWIDLTTVNNGLKGFTGGFTDGRYGYFVPGNNGESTGKVARVDLQNFSINGVSYVELTTIETSLMGFTGGFTDGRYGYFVPRLLGQSGKVTRIDLQNFTTSGVSWIDLTTLDSNLKGFYGGFTDGRYGYFVPFSNGLDFYTGKIARIQLFNGKSGP